MSKDFKLSELLKPEFILFVFFILFVALVLLFWPGKDTFVVVNSSDGAKKVCGKQDLELNGKRFIKCSIRKINRLNKSEGTGFRDTKGLPDQHLIDLSKSLKVSGPKFMDCSSSTEIVKKTSCIQNTGVELKELSISNAATSLQPKSYKFQDVSIRTTLGNIVENRPEIITVKLNCGQARKLLGECPPTEFFESRVYEYTETTTIKYLSKDRAWSGNLYVDFKTDYINLKITKSIVTGNSVVEKVIKLSSDEMLELFSAEILPSYIDGHGGPGHSNGSGVFVDIRTVDPEVTYQENLEVKDKTKRKTTLHIIQIDGTDTAANFKEVKKIITESVSVLNNNFEEISIEYDSEFYAFLDMNTESGLPSHVSGLDSHVKDQALEFFKSSRIESEEEFDQSKLVKGLLALMPNERSTNHFTTEMLQNDIFMYVINSKRIGDKWKGRNILTHNFPADVQNKIPNNLILLNAGIYSGANSLNNTVVPAHEIGHSFCGVHRKAIFVRNECYNLFEQSDILEAPATPLYYTFKVVSTQTQKKCSTIMDKVGDHSCVLQYFNSSKLNSIIKEREDSGKWEKIDLLADTGDIPTQEVVSNFLNMIHNPEPDGPGPSYSDPYIVSVNDGDIFTNDLEILVKWSAAIPQTYYLDLEMVDELAVKLEDDTTQFASFNRRTIPEGKVELNMGKLKPGSYVLRSYNQLETQLESISFSVTKAPEPSILTYYQAIKSRLSSFWSITVDTPEDEIFIDEISCQEVTEKVGMRLAAEQSFASGFLSGSNSQYFEDFEQGSTLFVIGSSDCQINKKFSQVDNINLAKERARKVGVRIAKRLNVSKPLRICTQSQPREKDGSCDVSKSANFRFAKVYGY